MATTGPKGGYGTGSQTPGSTTGVGTIRPDSTDIRREESQEILGRSSTAKTSQQAGAKGAAIVGGEESRGFRDGPGPQLMTADTLTGDEVVNAAGENLGEIRNIMLDVQHGRVAYAVLSFGGFLGLGEKLFAIPWHALTLDADNKCFILNVDKDKLKNAPGFDKDNWPAMADRSWATQLHQYYGTRPYWE